MIITFHENNYIEIKCNKFDGTGYNVQSQKESVFLIDDGDIIINLEYESVEQQENSILIRRKKDV